MTIRISREECRDFPASITREWLVTNGLGGYGCGTVAGPNTRRYHGILMAALRPPVERVLLVAGLEAWFVPGDGEPQPLFAHEYGNGLVEPTGYQFLEEVRVTGSGPVFRWRTSEHMLERRTWMEQGRNCTVTTFRLLKGRAGSLRIRPLFAHRPADAQRHGQATTDVDSLPRGWRVHLDGLASCVLTWPVGLKAQSPQWRRLFHRAERERALDDEEDLFVPGLLELPLEPGAPATVVASVDDLPPGWSPGESLRAARAVERETVAAAGNPARRSPLVRQLVFAAAQFRVERLSRHASARDRTQRSVIAGYPWFADWGRDTMIGLRGLTLSAGAPADARRILETFIAHLDQGMLPNAFHDPGEPIEYNTMDATLWLFQAIHHYLEATDDWEFVFSRRPALEEIIGWHLKGTRYCIRVDPADGLLAGGVPGYGLTWMDARDGDWVVTPRHGKPVEIAALWYNALRLLAAWRLQAGMSADPYQAMADRARGTAQQRFWYGAGGYLYDVIDSPEGDDFSLRPNQLIALGLVHPLIAGERARAALDVVTAKLLTPFGLRTLAPDDPRYQHRFRGDHRRRDAAYQMGLVWPWLLGPYLDAHIRVHGDPAVTGRILAPFETHLREAGLGSVSEIFESEPPYRPVGAIAQAWSVGELLWHGFRASGG